MKNGMKSVLPMKAILFIRADVLGIILLTARPARNAPMIGSKPPSCAKNDDMNMMASTRMKCAPFSFSKRRKNSFSTQGNSLKIVRNSTMPDSSMRKANPQPTCPELCPSRSARSMSAAVSVIIVPPTVTATDTSFTTSILLAIG